MVEREGSEAPGCWWAASVALGILLSLLPPAAHPWWVRRSREAGHRIAAEVYERGGNEVVARIAAYLSLALAVVLGLIALGVALSLVAGA
jgi:hypothetical protein